MEPYYITLWLATSALLIITALLFRRKTPQLRLPPGPKPWPIIGNLNLIGKLPHRSIHKLTLKHGPLIYLRLGSNGVIVGSSVHMAETILKTMDISFAERPRTSGGKYLLYNYSDVTWLPYGPNWRQARRFFFVELFSAKRLESYEYIRVEEMKSTLKKFYKLQGENKEILLKDQLSTFSLNVISRIVLGKRYLEESENSIVTVEEFKAMTDELFILMGVLNIGDSLPWLKFLDLQGYVRRMKACAKKFDILLEQILNERNAVRQTEGENFVAKDMLDVLLQLADDPDLEHKPDKRNIKAFTIDLLGAGTESSMTVVEWAMSEILKNPEVFGKAIKELDRVVGRERWVDEKDIPNLPYIEAIVKETMRLHPSSPMLTPRVAREDCQLEGYDIPKGTWVFVHIWAMARDPSIWENPDKFFPDRFIGKDIDVKGQHFALLPFGAGRRMCPGYMFGLKVIPYALASLLHGFEWKLPSPMKIEDLDMEEVFGLSMLKKIPLVAVAKARLPQHVYADL